MSQLAGQLDQQSIADVVRTVYRRRATGVLTIDRGESRRRFFFVHGELHLPGDQPLGAQMADLLDEERLAVEPVPNRAEGLGDTWQAREVEDGLRDPSKRAEATSHVHNLVSRIVDLMVDWTDGEFCFDTDAVLPDDLTGPLPTAYLVMESSVRDLDEADLMLALGGEEALLVADADSEVLRGFHGLDTGEMFLLSRLERPTPLDAVLQQIPGRRVDVLRMLCRLQAIDLVVQTEASGPAQGQRGAPSATVVDRFSARIAERLETEPLDLAADQHRRRIGELLASKGGANHYELLGIGFHSEPAELHDAYERLARLTHPAHAERLGLTDKAPLLQMLFERATMAYLTLSDSERRAEYNRDAAVDATADSSNVRPEEKRQLALDQYQQAIKLEDSGEHHFALELARLAVRTDPRPEYFALLGRIQALNPKWLDQASESYRQAIRRDPANAEYRMALAQVMEQLGEPGKAKFHYRAALRGKAEAVEAHAAIRRLDRGAASVPERGLLARLRRLFARR